MKKKRAKIIIITLLAILITLPFLNYLMYNLLTASLIHKSAENFDKRPLLVLGAGSSSIYDPRENFAFTSRMNGAYELYRLGLTEEIVVSGASNKKNYNEPNDMKKYLIELGIPSHKIFPDHGGTRTYFSVLRMKNYYKHDKIIIASQREQLQRALVIAMYHGIDAVGYDCGKIPPPLPKNYYSREFFARMKSGLDCFILQPEIP